MGVTAPLSREGLMSGELLMVRLFFTTIRNLASERSSATPKGGSQNLLETAFGWKKEKPPGNQPAMLGNLCFEKNTCWACLKTGIRTQPCWCSFKFALNQPEKGTLVFAGWILQTVTTCCWLQEKTKEPQNGGMKPVTLVWQ